MPKSIEIVGEVAEGSQARLEFDPTSGDLLLHRSNGDTEKVNPAPDSEVQIIKLSTAITANSTTTTRPAGTLAFTSHATGRGYLFYSDGSKWQNLLVFVPV